MDAQEVFNPASDKSDKLSLPLCFLGTHVSSFLFYLVDHRLESSLVHEYKNFNKKCFEG